MNKNVIEEKKQKISIEIGNPNTAGINIGSQLYFVAVGQVNEGVKIIWFLQRRPQSHCSMDQRRKY